MGTKPKSYKCCATCQYWSGPREVKPSYVLYDDGGWTCTAASSPYKGKTVKGYSNCGHWMKWVAI